MTRFGVMKHLRVLEDAGLVVTRRAGREKLHFLNPVPIRLIHDRWIDKYTERRVAALADLKTNWRRQHDHADRSTTTQVYQVFIKATPEQIWDAITKPEFTQQYFYGARIEVDATARRFATVADGELGTTARCSSSTRRGGSCTAGRRSTTRRLAAEETSRVTWEIEPQDGGYLQAHRRPRPARGRAEDGRERLRRGWMFVLSGLKTLLETGEPLSG